MIILLGTIILTIRTGCTRKIGTILLTFKRDKNSTGDLSQLDIDGCFGATIGTGNIIRVGNCNSSQWPGAVFWCWLTGIDIALSIRISIISKIIGLKQKVTKMLVDRCCTNGDAQTLVGCILLYSNRLGSIWYRKYEPGNSISH